MARVARWLVVLAWLPLMGCELIADFDRGKLSPPEIDASFVAHDAGLGEEDAGEEDAGK